MVSALILKPLFTFIHTHWLLLTAAITVLISALSLYPAESLPPVPGTDKTHHFIAYAALAFPVALARPKMWLYFIIGILAYSGLIELIQPYVNRYGEWLDFGANALGILLGVLLATGTRWLFMKEQKI